MFDQTHTNEERIIGSNLKQIHNQENDLSQNQVTRMWLTDFISQINVDRL